eukprot:g690.t1
MILSSITQRNFKQTSHPSSEFHIRSFNAVPSGSSSLHFTLKPTRGFTGRILIKPPNPEIRELSRNVVCRSSLGNLLIGVGLFLTPGVVFCLYALILGKGDFRHGVSVALSEITRGYLQPELGGPNVPVCDADISEVMSGKPLFCFLYDWFIKLGGVWKLEFGPKAFLVVSDPVCARYILKENMMNYDKGLLAEILEPIMGKGLIPADLETWKIRRKVITPAFHDQYIKTMTTMFGRCCFETIEKFQKQLEDNKNSDGIVVDMESEFLSLALDIIGLGVFNHDFGSITRESPVIKAVYGVLKEAEHRSTFYFPYWNIPGANFIVPRLRLFQQHLTTLKTCLDELIENAKATAHEDDLEHLQARDYSKVTDPSLLRFLVEMRGEDHSTTQLKDDLMTFLIAGHETTAALLTWTLYLLSQNPEWIKRIQNETDTILKNDIPNIDQVKQMENTRLVLAEALRLYPQPPLLIRRAIGPDVVPGGKGGPTEGFPVGPGGDIFISSWNLHRSPDLWTDPESFNPDRFRHPFVNEDFNDKWSGYQPGSEGSSLYPNETASDFAFLPFGGGGRRCIGDQFAFLESCVCLSMLIRRFNFELNGPPDVVQMESGATIHTTNGLPMKVTCRNLAVSVVDTSSQTESPQHGAFRAGSSISCPIRVSFTERPNVEMELDEGPSQFTKMSFAQLKSYPIYSLFNGDGDLIEITNLEPTHSFTDFHLKTRSSAASDLFDQFNGLPELPEVFGNYPEWNRSRPFLTGHHIWGRVDQNASRDVIADDDLMNDLLYVFMGLNGQFIGPKFKSRPDGHREMKFEIRVKVEATSHALLMKILPLCESVLIVQRFIEMRSGLEYGTVCHAISASIQSILDDWFLLVTQLEGQLIEGKLTFQKLWFYVQPAMSVISVLAEMCQKTAVHDLRGTELLNLLYVQIQQYSGSQNSQALLQKLLEAGCVPYFQVLEKWLCEGVLNDPFSEFMIEENKKVETTMTTPDLQSSYWLNRYKIRKTFLLVNENKELASIHCVPHFLRNSTDLILKTGKYLNAIKECGRVVKRPLDANEHIVYETGGTSYQSLIQKAHQFASQAFLNLFIKDLSLVDWLRGLKHFFLMDKGDMIGHLMDIAREELDKTASQVVVNRMQSLLELACKTSSIPAETSIESLKVELDHRSMVDLSVCLKQPQMKRTLHHHHSSIRSSLQRSSFLPARVSEIAANNRASNLAEELTGWDIFMINYTVEWPMMLIVPPNLMQMYQLLFKQLFSLKRTEFELSKTWKILQKTRKLIDNRFSGALRLFQAICYQMQYTVNQYLRYLSVHTIEPRWQAMERNLLKAKDIDSVIGIHKNFIDKVLWQSLLRKVKGVKELDYVINLSLLFTRLVASCLDVEVTSEEMNVMISGLRTKPTPSEIISEKNRLLNSKIEAALTGEGVEEKIMKIRNDYNTRLNALVSTLLDYCDTEAGDRSNRTGSDELQSREDLDRLISLAESIKP